MNRRQTFWSDSEINQLKYLVSQGDRTDAEIAVILGRSRVAITRKRQGLGLMAYRHRLHADDPKLIAGILKFKMIGWSNERIGKIYGSNKSNIAQFLGRLGFSKRFRAHSAMKYPYQRWTEIELNQLRKYLKKEYPIERIHAYFPNRTFEAVRIKASEITRHWGTPEERRKRREFEKRARAKQLRVY